MSDRTAEFLQEQKRLVADCATYNFGMRNADRLAHVEAPKLIAAVEAVMEALAFGDELDKTAHEYINPTARRLQIANRVLNRIEQRIEAALGGEGE